MYSWLRRSFSRSKTSSTNNKEDNQNLGNSHQKKAISKEEEEEFYGVTDQLVEFMKSFTIDTFKNCSLPDEEIDGSQTTSGGVRVDLSEWQQQHAVIILSKVKERQFWRIYFTLVKSYATEYELRAIQLDKLRRMALGNETRSDTNGIELEMTESKQTTLHRLEESMPYFPSSKIQMSTSVICEELQTGS